MGNRIYIAIDLKSFYASVECVDRGLDSMTTNLVVADASRTNKTICLAVSPSLKAYGIPGRARLFEVEQAVKRINGERLAALEQKNRQLSSKNRCLAMHEFQDKSVDANALAMDSSLELDYIAAVPRMGKYMEISTQIYHIYLNYIAPEDIHVYSIDEVFMDVTSYLNTYQMTAKELAITMIHDVLRQTGITATAGIGTNMYLAKVAMDIVAKHIPADEHGVRIAELNEKTYRERLWSHQPLTDFWRVGRGYARKLKAAGIYTMGDIARCSLGKETDFYNEDLLYKMFGINAELLIDHAWGYEPTTIADIRGYKPQNNSLGSGQVLHCPYEADKAKLIMKEMTDLLVLDLVRKHLVTKQMVLTIGYDRTNLENPDILDNYNGPISVDFYGRTVPKHAHGTVNLRHYTSSAFEIMQALCDLYDRIVDPNLLVRRVNISANHVKYEKDVPTSMEYQQMDLFSDFLEKEKTMEQDARLEKEKQLQSAMLDIKKKFGKNAILKGMNLEEGATTIDRNKQIGGHKA